MRACGLHSRRGHRRHGALTQRGTCATVGAAVDRGRAPASNRTPSPFLSEVVRMSARSVLITAATVFVIVAIIGNVGALRNIAIPGTPRFGA